MHQRPHGPGRSTRRRWWPRESHPAARSTRRVQEQRLQPVVASQPAGSATRRTPRMPANAARVALEQAALFGEKHRKLLELSATQGCIEVRHSIVVADLVVAILPSMRQFRRGGDVLGAPGELRIVGDDGASPAGGNGLVAVEAEGTHEPERAGMSSANGAADATRLHLPARSNENPGQRPCTPSISSGMSERVHRHECTVSRGRSRG